MTITSYIESSMDLTVFISAGVLTFDSAMSAVEAFYAGASTKNVIWDMTETQEVRLTFDEVKRIATYGPRIEGKRAMGKTAFVAKKDLLFGLSRMFEIQSTLVQSPYPVNVFRTREEAYQWINES